ncbi:claudin-3-like [Neopelma chrysocephalum]|uniref:claudin-3-like n=1 Tax=Neopelma chrysocephalum TaxID=114329 RepID=UPI000FCCF10A|nr:claudin-3-like [Neopelma chrysocephalum]
METMSRQTSALVTAVVGWVATILTCALPMWRVTNCLGSNSIGSQSYSDGLWVTCANDGTAQSQCRYYSSLLEITPDLQVARVLVVAALITTFAGILIALARGAFSSCMGGGGNKGAYISVTGALFVASAVLLLVAVSWTTSNIVNNSYTPTGPEAVSREVGAAIYIGFIATALLLAGGIALSRLGTQYPQDSYAKNYRGVKTCDSTGYPMKDYV